MQKCETENNAIQKCMFKTCGKSVILDCEKCEKCDILGKHVFD